jgi:hypothetical protein
MAFFDKLGEFGQGFAQGFSSTLPAALDERRRRKWREEDQGLRQVETLKRDSLSGSNDALRQLADLDPDAFYNVFDQRHKSAEGQLTNITTEINNAFTDIDTVLAADLNDVDPNDIDRALNTLKAAQTYSTKLDTLGSDYNDLVKVGGRMPIDWQIMHTKESMDDMREMLRNKKVDIRHNQVMFADLNAARNTSWEMGDAGGYAASNRSLFERGHIGQEAFDAGNKRADRHFAVWDMNKVAQTDLKTALDIAKKHGYNHYIDLYSTLLGGQTYGKEMERFQQMVGAGDHHGALLIIENSENPQLVQNRNGLLEQLFSAQQQHYNREQHEYNKEVVKIRDSLLRYDGIVARYSTQGPSLEFINDATGEINQGTTVGSSKGISPFKSYQQYHEMALKESAGLFKREFERDQLIKAAGGIDTNISAALIENFELGLPGYLDQMEADFQPTGQTPQFNKSVVRKEAAELFRDKIVGIDALTYREQNEIVQHLIAGYGLEEEAWIPGVRLKKVVPEGGRFMRMTTEGMTPPAVDLEPGSSIMPDAGDPIDLFGGAVEPYAHFDPSRRDPEIPGDPYEKFGEDYDLIRTGHASTRSQHKRLYEWVDKQIRRGITTIAGTPRSDDDSDTQAARRGGKQGAGAARAQEAADHTHRFLRGVQSELYDKMHKGELTPAANIQAIMAAIEASIKTGPLLDKGEAFLPWDRQDQKDFLTPENLDPYALMQIP